MKYADLIRAALDGKKIQYLVLVKRQTGSGKYQWVPETGKWITFSDNSAAVRLMAAEYASYDFRLEPPPPPPDVVRFGRTCNVDYHSGNWVLAENTTYWTRHPSGLDNLKATFDGATGKLKSVEIVE